MKEKLNDSDLLILENLVHKYLQHVADKLDGIGEHNYISILTRLQKEYQKIIDKVKLVVEES